MGGASWRPKSASTTTATVEPSPEQSIAIGDTFEKMPPHAVPPGPWEVVEDEGQGAVIVQFEDFRLITCKATLLNPARWTRAAL